MVIRDKNKLRYLFSIKGAEKQNQIAKAMNVSQNTVTRWFQGEAVHRGQARRVADFLGWKVEEIFAEKNEATHA